LKPAFFSVNETIWRMEALSSTARIEYMAGLRGNL
jgi:hypothetical protein